MGDRALSAPWPAPAKINLFLHVVARRADGYHELQTIFQFLDRADRLAFEPTSDGRIRRINRLAGIPENEDLAVRAARSLQQAAGVSKGVSIRIEKRIPVGGGLGGGSSDAATTLMALNRLWDTGLSTTELAELGLRLGADVPVFVSGTAAWAEGVGERLTPVAVPEPWYVVLVPPVQVCTARVFAELKLTGSRRPLTIRDFRAGRVYNDLEPVVRRCYPEVDGALRWLGRFAEARMSGAGACVFAPVAGPEQGRAILARLPEGLEGFVARGLNRSPLLARLSAPGAGD